VSAYDEQFLRNKTIYSYQACGSYEVEFKFDLHERKNKLNQRILAWNPQYEIIEN
jgi:hypothetical protein